MQNWIHQLESTDDGRRLLEQERIIVELTESVAALMDERGVTKSELARRMGKSPAFITKLLRGNNNFTVRTLCDVFYRLGSGIRVETCELGSTPATTGKNALRFSWQKQDTQQTLQPLCPSNDLLPAKTAQISKSANTQYALAA